MNYGPLILVIHLLLWSNAFAEIAPSRQFQLDSITTNVDKNLRADFDRVHDYLHNQGKNDEERVWLFYGYIATHFKYDEKRKNDDSDPAIYSPEYTAQRRSGVCRDFAKVFQALCTKSHIPCLEVSGKAKVSFFEHIRETFGRWKKLNFHRPVSNHAWNVVRINDAWQLMDPTWSFVTTTAKIRVFDKKSKSYKVTLVKSVSHTYFNPEPGFMLSTHVPIHPAFLLMEKVPTFRTAAKKPKRHKVFADHYAFNHLIDSIYQSTYPLFSKVYYYGCKEYCKGANIVYHYEYAISLPVQKTGKFNQPTIESYDRAILEAKQLTDTIYASLGLDFRGRFNEFEMEALKKKAKLVKLKEAEEKKKKRVKT